MNMSRNQRETRSRRPKQLPLRWRRAGFQSRNRRVTRISDAARTKSISSAANNRAVSWTIGSKPKSNSNLRSFRARRRRAKLSQPEEDGHEIEKFDT